jgi:deazaflavin-dependent oxidoreductase (nitroreductase family)
MDSPAPISETQLRLIKPFMRLFTNLNVWIYKCSGGKLMNRFGGGDVCLVRMTGAKSGVTKEIPLMYVPYQDGIILVASMAGAPKHPSWYYNLVAHPQIEVTVHSKRMQLAARQATDAEKTEVWPLCCEHYGDFDLYQRRTPRNIPIFICLPA